MAHPDHETRVGAHNIFSIVLMPSIKCPKMALKTISSETVSWLPFGSATQKLIGGSFSFKDGEKHASEPLNGVRREESQTVDFVAEKSETHLSRRGSSSFNHSFSEGNTV